MEHLVWLTQSHSQHLSLTPTQDKRANDLLTRLPYSYGCSDGAILASETESTIQWESPGNMCFSVKGIVAAVSTLSSVFLLWTQTWCLKLWQSSWNLSERPKESERYWLWYHWAPGQLIHKIGNSLLFGPTVRDINIFFLIKNNITAGTQQ